MKTRWALPLFIAVVIAVLLAVLRVHDHAPATVVPASDKSTFSAERAYAHLEDLLRENVGHPAGSAANRVIEDRIAAKLRSWGYEPELQAGLKCSPLAPGCSVVRNIIAVRKGREAADAVMVTAHYDSVPGSAAAADDGAGVAAMLEMAERLATHPPLLHDIVFLFADAEEPGLRGAMHFVDSHPLMKRVAFVLNMEARGASGPSLMFETGSNNAAVISAFAEVVPNPVSNSLLFEAYRNMPNNTDFTIYKRAGAGGLNFAFSRSASLYHSERDDLVHLSRESLQHQGESVSAVLLRIADTPVDDLKASDNATWFDLGGRMLLRWPASWNAWLAAVGLIGVIVLGVRHARSGWRATAWSVLALITAIVLLPLLGALLTWPLGFWPNVHSLDHPYPWPGRIALIAASLVVTFLVAHWLSKRVEPGAMATTAWTFIGLVSLACALTLPGTTYVFVVPLLAYVASAAIFSPRLRGDREPLQIASVVAFVPAAYMALYHFIQLDALFGFDASYAKVVPLWLLSLPLLPLAIVGVRRHGVRSPLLASIAIMVVMTVAALIVPATTRDRPRGVNLLYVQDDAGANWQIESFGEPGREVLEAMGFEATKQATLRYGVSPIDAYMKPAPGLALPAPDLLIEEDFERDGKRVLRGNVRSRRETWQVGIGLPAKSPVSSMTVEGQPVLEGASSEPRLVRVHGVGDAPVHFEITARSGESLTLIPMDIGALDHAGEAAQMLSRRPDTAAPLHAGNQSIVLTRRDL